METANSSKPGNVSALAYKLGAFTKLSAEDRTALAGLGRDTCLVDPRRDVIAEGDRASHVHLVLDGWACRYKSLPNGKRQIVGLCIAGDFCDFNAYSLKSLDHSIGAITRLRVARITPEQMDTLIAGHPRVGHALWWQELVEKAIEHEWALNLGQRNAYERLAHLLIELYLRLKTVNLAEGGRCDFPPTQNDLADTTGLTAVHVNRMIQQLRTDGLIELERKQLQIVDIGRLMDAAMFNPNYLHLDHEGRHLDANE